MILEVLRRNLLVINRKLLVLLEILHITYTDSF